MSRNEIIPIIAGPTAVGKSDVCLRLAEHLDAEIISADSRQVYREFSIGTASPTLDDCQRVRHHFVREISIGDPFSAGIFARRVQHRVDEVSKRKKRILVAGGSTLYVHALLEGLDDIPPVDPDIRTELNRRLADEGAEPLYQELMNVDPEFCASLDSTKSQRIVRGLEVFMGTGKPLSTFHTPSPLSGIPSRLFVLHRERQHLYERINLRVDQMIEDGLVQEIKAILATKPDLSDNAFRTIGYQEIIPALSGEYSLEEAIGLIKRNSRRYAKRQLTWYKRYKDAVWVDVDEADAFETILDEIHSTEFTG